jgi:hypothetical protein
MVASRRHQVGPSVTHEVRPVGSGLDHVLVRAGVHWRVRGDRTRLRVGAGVPVAGNERTNAILDLALVRDR